MTIKKIAVVGAGIFGCSISIELDKEGYEVVLFDKEYDVMLKASKSNHNRIHYGYHYPRSLETTKQSLDGLLSFILNYSKSINFGFKNYYAIAKEDSLTSAHQFKEFCNEAGISYKVGFPSEYLMNRNLIDEAYLVEEPVYDWHILQSIVKEKLKNSKIKLRLNSNFIESSESFDFVVNCTYSNLNEVSRYMNVNEMSFKKQDVIIPIIKSNIDRTGLTVMDGPFCSVMPKGFDQGKFLLYHAKYSVVEEVISSNLKMTSDVLESAGRILNYSMEYFPFLRNSELIDCWRTCRAIPINNNDQRLSEIITYDENPNFITVFSGKISTAVKIAKNISTGLRSGNFNSHILV